MCQQPQESAQGQGSPGGCVCKVTGTAAPETSLSVKASSVHSLCSPWSSPDGRVFEFTGCSDMDSFAPPRATIHRNPPVQNLLFQQQKMIAQRTCQREARLEAPDPHHRPHQMKQHVKPSTIIGERCIPSREDSAWRDNNGAPTSSQEELVSRPRAPASHTEEDTHLPIACSLSASCSEPSVEEVDPVIEPLLVCLMVFLTFDTRSDCHRALVPSSSDLYNSSVVRTSATM